MSSEGQSLPLATESRVPAKGVSGSWRRAWPMTNLSPSGDICSFNKYLSSAYWGVSTVRHAEKTLGFQAAVWSREEPGALGPGERPLAGVGWEDSVMGSSANQWGRSFQAEGRPQRRRAAGDGGQVQDRSAPGPVCLRRTCWRGAGWGEGGG